MATLPNFVRTRDAPTRAIASCATNAVMAAAVSVIAHLPSWLQNPHDPVARDAHGVLRTNHRRLRILRRHLGGEHVVIRSRSDRALLDRLVPVALLLREILLRQQDEIPRDERVVERRRDVLRSRLTEPPEL